METHTPYQQVFGHGADFKVRYRLYSFEEGGRYRLPNQGIRFNFWYESPNHEFKGDFMIYPEFEDEQGNLIEGTVNPEGVARMWILSPDLRPYHQQRIKVGTIGYFKEGHQCTGICEVIEGIDLHKNPVATG